MIDENLPTFYLKPSPEQSQYQRAYYLTYRGSDPEAAYCVRHPDPSSPGGRNCYAAALYDAFNSDVLFGEVLIRPEWTLPSLSQEDIRRNGGVPSAPQPILPQEFTIQLYNPDQQVIVRQKPGGWGGAPSYQFSMPQQTFRQPSASALDRALSDPAADMTTPQINFLWKRESKLTKEMACYMTGKSNDVVKKKHREPDIIVGIFQALREMTIYESNYHRIEIEDPKGLEVVLLLCGLVLKDVYFAPIREAFNVGDAPPQALRKHSSNMNLMSGALQRKSPTQQVPHLLRPEASSSSPLAQPGTGGVPPAALGGLYAVPSSIDDNRRKSLPYLQTSAPAPPQFARPLPADPRSQWEIDAETARLQAQSDAERRALEARRREQEKADAAEAKRLRKIMDAEEKEARRRQAEIDKETERLRKKYGDQTGLMPPLPPRLNQSTPNFHQHQHQQPYGAAPPQQYQHQHHPYMQPGQASASSFFRPPELASQQEQPGRLRQKKSFWHLSSSRDMSGALPPQERNLIRRKSSVMF